VRTSGRAGFAVGARAAVLGEIGDQGIHLREIGAYADHATLAFVGDQAGAAQHIQVRAQGGGRQVEAVAQLADGQSCRAGFDQRLEGGQATDLAKCTQGIQRGIGLHDSIIPETWNHVKRCEAAATIR
jgi:hypothetical protein